MEGVRVRARVSLTLPLPLALPLALTLALAITLTRWKEWVEHEQPETQPLPQEWKRLSGFRQLMIMRALRPDRMTLAILRWVGDVLGSHFMTAINFDLALSFEDSGTPQP